MPAEPKKILIITYYWPPSGGSGVQRWMYFAFHLQQMGYEPVVLTVDEKLASYKFTDKSFEEKVKHIRSVKTHSREPFGLYSRMIGAKRQEAIPLGFSGESNPGLRKKIGRFIRGNFFIPDARVGWVRPALNAARKLLRQEKFQCIVTTGPPHSAHLIGLRLKKDFDIKWIADFRDPWSELYYNKMLYRTHAAENYDRSLEMKVLKNSDLLLTVGPSMKELLANKTGIDRNKVHYIYNGFDADALLNLKKSAQTDLFTILHLGILSDNQPISGFLEALKQFHKINPDAFSKIRLQLIGKISPAILEEIKSSTPFLKTEVLEYVPHSKALQYMTDADLLFNSLAATDQGKYLISGKLMEYLATGNPVLCLGEPDGDAAQLLSGFSDAKVFARSDISGMCSFIENIFRNHGKKQHLPDSEKVLQYSRENTTKQLRSLLDA